MDKDSGDRDQAQFEAALDTDTALLDSAIRMVASGRARAVTVVGLRVAVAAMAILGPLAGDLGVTLEPLWGAGDAVLDVRVVRHA